jgi:hypothetical protein
MQEGLSNFTLLMKALLVLLVSVRHICGNGDIHVSRENKQSVLLISSRYLEPGTFTVGVWNW